MPRPPRIDPPGSVCHVTTRGVDGLAVFRDDADRHQYLRLLERAMRTHVLSCLTYVLMGNHVHLLLVSHVGQLSEAMQLLNGRYAQRFNRRHERRGPLWGGRYHPEPVRTDRHLREAIAYIADNPVRAGLSSSPEGWRWSGHRELVGAVPARIVDVDTTLRYFAAHGGEGLHRYRDYLAARSRRGDAEMLPTTEPGSLVIPQEEPAPPLVMPSRIRSL